MLPIDSSMQMPFSLKYLAEVVSSIVMCLTSMIASGFDDAYAP